MSDFSLKPGVVTGEGYKTLVEAAKAGGYALPAVNVVGTNSINACMEAAANANSDIIIQLSNSGGAFFAGAGMDSPEDAEGLAVAARFGRWSGSRPGSGKNGSSSSEPGFSLSHCVSRPCGTCFRRPAWPFH